MAEGNRPSRHHAGPVGTTRREYIEHLCHRAGVGKVSIETNFSGYSTHGGLIVLLAWPANRRRIKKRCGCPTPPDFNCV